MREGGAAWVLPRRRKKFDYTGCSHQYRHTYFLAQLESVNQLVADILGTGLDLETDRTISARQCRISARQKTQRIEKERHIKDVLGELPGDGEAIHIVSGSKFDFWTWVPHLARLIGPPVTLWCSTWTASRHNVQELGEMLADGRVANAHMLTGTYFKRRETAVYTTLVETIRKHAGSRYVAFQNHAKVLLLDDGKQYLTVEGIANLTSNPRLEQYVLSGSQLLHEFHRTWMEEAFTLPEKTAKARRNKDQPGKLGFSQAHIGDDVIAARSGPSGKKEILHWKMAPTSEREATMRLAAAIVAVVRATTSTVSADAFVTCPPRGGSVSIGWDAAHRLAEEVARQLGLPFVAARVRDGSAVKGREAIVIDDFVTTGRTIRESIDALKTVGILARGFVYSGR